MDLRLSRRIKPAGHRRPLASASGMRLDMQIFSRLILARQTDFDKSYCRSYSLFLLPIIHFRQLIHPVSRPLQQAFRVGQLLGAAALVLGNRRLAGRLVPLPDPGPFLVPQHDKFVLRHPVAQSLIDYIELIVPKGQGRIGRRLLVVPSWEEQPETARTVLRLDPGLAFGTGAHHTTRMCLEYLEETVRAGDAVLDLGCGSGILSIAARLLGAREAVAVDIDPIAEHIARENAAMNGIGEAGYRIEIGDVLTDTALRGRIARQYDVVVANIVADVIIRLAPFAFACCRPGAPFIVSGVIDEREDEVAGALRQAGFADARVRRAEGWIAMCVRRPL